jgi:hypothetical protein
MPRGGFRIGSGMPKKGIGWRERQKQKYLLNKKDKIVKAKVCKSCGEEYSNKRYKYCSEDCCLKENKKTIYERNLSNHGKRKEYRESGKTVLNERLRIRRTTDPSFALSKRTSCLVRDCLKGRIKNGRSWQALVGYSVDDLRQHIENQFKDGMTWERFLAGEIHIDHKIPVSAFNFITTEDIDFKRCWAISNLQPLWAKDNLKKKDKLLKPFQPSLAIAV